MFDPEKMCSMQLVLVAKCCEEKNSKDKECQDLIKKASACVASYGFMASSVSISNYLAFIQK